MVRIGDSDVFDWIQKQLILTTPPGNALKVRGLHLVSDRYHKCYVICLLRQRSKGHIHECGAALGESAEAAIRIKKNLFGVEVLQEILDPAHDLFRILDRISARIRHAETDLVATGPDAAAVLRLVRTYAL